MESPEAILARFAAEYAEHGPGPERMLQIQESNGKIKTGYIDYRGDDWKIDYPDGSGWMFVSPHRITRIDYSNARYRGAQPLWERDPS